MSTAETKSAGIDLQILADLADLDAVMKRIIDGTQVDPETSRRIEERADRITEEIRRTRGVMDDARCRALLHDDDDAYCGTPYGVGAMGTTLIHAL
jgi:hypothetical protein